LTAGLPFKKPHGADTHPSQLAFNIALGKMRAAVEHAIAHLYGPHVHAASAAPAPPSNAPRLPDYWAADTLAELGAHVHLAHPLGVKMFSYRRVKNDELDAGDLADLLRMGRLPEAWIAPPATRELRGWVRHRAKLVGLRSNLKCQVHAVLAGAGVQVSMSDLFGPGGQRLLTRIRLAVESRSRVDSVLRAITALDFEIDTFARLLGGRLRTDPGYRAI
jgi:transposase